VDGKDKTVYVCGAVRSPNRDFRVIEEDPDYNGIYLDRLRKGDEIIFETTIGNQGYALRAKIRLVAPQSGLVEIVSLVKFSEIFTKEMRQEDFGITTPVVSVRGRRKGKVVIGWIGLGSEVMFNSGISIQRVREIIINGSKVFPQSNTTRH